MTKSATQHYTLGYLQQKSHIVRKLNINGKRVWVWANGLFTECDRGDTMHHNSTVTLMITRQFHNGIDKLCKKKNPKYHIRREPSDTCHRTEHIEGKEFARIHLKSGMTLWYWGENFGHIDTYTLPGSNVQRIFPCDWLGERRFVNTKTGKVTWK